MTTAAAVRERPILFSGEMVLAILEGRKTQTRRVVLPQPDWIEEVRHTLTDNGPFAWPIGSLGQQCGWPLPLRYQIGGRLWVRESLYEDIDSTWRYRADDAPIELDADDRCVPRMVSWAYHQQSGRCPSIHMPRWASRLTLEITGIRVERLQQITEGDAIAEGVEQIFDGRVSWLSPDGGRNFFARDAFLDRWNSLNAKRGYGWSVNPWVWVVEFRKVTP